MYYDKWSGFDFDVDGLTDLVDGCPTVAGNTGTDSDGDGVDDACDTCRRNDNFNNEENLDLGPNPALTGGLPANRTAVSGQIDDDGDGIGDQCDFDYDNAGAVITATDFNHMKASVGKLVTASTCGLDAAQRCGEFDHDGLGAVVSATDFNKTKQAVGGVIVGPPNNTAWDKMSCGEACTPPLSAPIGGPIQPTLGKAICQGVACQ